MTTAGSLKRIPYDVRRLAQTGRTFANWPDLVRQLAGKKLGGGGDVLTFRVRSGPTLTTPNVPGARLPMYEQFADDCYDLDWVLGPDRGSCLVLDVGSHVGAFATNVAWNGPGVRVECYEPSPESARFLRRNIEQNGLADRMRVHEQALAATFGTADLEDNAGGSVHNGLRRDDHRLVAGTDSLADRRVITVQTTTFDQAVAAAPGPVDVVKMDCEGGEYELVYASSPESWRSVQRVVMEYHPVDGESWAELSGWLGRAGLDVVRHEPNAPGLGTAWLARRP